MDHVRRLLVSPAVNSCDSWGGLYVGVGKLDSVWRVLLETVSSGRRLFDYVLRLNDMICKNVHAAFE